MREVVFAWILTLKSAREDLIPSEWIEIDFGQSGAQKACCVEAMREREDSFDAQLIEKFLSGVASRNCNVRFIGLPTLHTRIWQIDRW